MIIFLIIFLIICIIMGFDGYPLLFIFPILAILIAVFVITEAKKKPNIEDIKNDDNKNTIKNDEIQDFIFFDMINKSK